jgi:hypothetical protein
VLPPAVSVVQQALSVVQHVLSVVLQPESVVKQPESVVLQNFFEKMEASCSTLLHDVYNDILIFTRRLYGLAIGCGELV